MPVVSVTRGQPATAEVFFRNPDQTPFAGNTPARYTVLDFKNNLVVQGNATQDMTNASHWLATFTIPLSAPVSDINQNYAVLWYIANSTNSMSAIEYFKVISDVDLIPPFEEAQLLMDGLGDGAIPGQSTVYTDTLVLNTNKLESLSVTLRTVTDSTLFSYTSIPLVPSAIVNGKYYYCINSTDATVDNLTGNPVGPGPVPGLVAANMGVCPYFAYWQYQIQGQPPQLEIHPIYVINGVAVMLMNDIRRQLDAIRNEDMITQLRWTDIRLFHFALQGIQTINESKPTITGWTLRSLPTQFYHLANQAGCLEAVKSQYIAEGYTTFDMQGAAVQMNADRTQYLQSMISQYEGYLNNTLIATKRAYVRSLRFGPMGQVQGVWGPSANVVVPISPVLLSRYKLSLPFMW